MSSDQPDEPDRGPGLLTTKQREYLLGQTEIESGTPGDRAIRSRIRHRVYQGLLDMSLVINYLDSDDRERVGVEYGDERWPVYERALTDTVELIYLLLDSESRFEEVIETAVMNAEAHRGAVEHAFQVAVTFEIIHASGVDFESVADRLADREFHRLAPYEVMQFVYVMMIAGVLDPQEAHEHYLEWREARNMASLFSDANGPENEE